MAAATADRDSRRTDGRLKAYPVLGSTRLYKGTLVGVSTSFQAGYLTRLDHGTTDLVFLGVTYEGADNSGGSLGAISCRVQKDGEYEFIYNGGDATQSLVGREVYAVDDQTVDED